MRDRVPGSWGDIDRSSSCPRRGVVDPESESAPVQRASDSALTRVVPGPRRGHATARLFADRYHLQTSTVFGIVASLRIGSSRHRHTGPDAA